MGNVVAIIGRPNVGKSTLFNRLVGDRVAIVLDSPGVTRDRIYGQGSWLTREFKVIDTGGIAKNKERFQEKIALQAELAIHEADIIIFLVDGQTGPVDDDYHIASLLQKSGKKVFVAVNKVDSREKIADNYAFLGLGLGELEFISATHGIGIGDLLDKIVKLFPPEEAMEPTQDCKIAIIGRPNVGKSSLLNALLREERVIVSEVAGTTRDAIDIAFEHNGNKYLLVDTAGLKRRGKIVEAVDKFSALRTFGAIEKSDVCLVLIDALEGFLDQDKQVINHAVTNGKGVIIVVNKYDLVNTDRNEFRTLIYKTLPAVDHIPIVFTSALNKSGLLTLLKVVNQVNESLNQKVTTSSLNAIILDAQQVQPAPAFNGGSLRIMYGLQDSSNPPQFTFFVNDPRFLHFSYQRYLENKIRDSYGFLGTPIKMKFRKKM